MHISFSQLISFLRASSDVVGNKNFVTLFLKNSHDPKGHQRRKEAKTMQPWNRYSEQRSSFIVYWNRFQNILVKGCKNPRKKVKRKLEMNFFPARANYFDEWRQYPGGAAAGKILKKNSSELREGHFLSVKHLLRRASTRQTWNITHLMYKNLCL